MSGISENQIVCACVRCSSSSIDMKLECSPEVDVERKGKDVTERKHAREEEIHDGSMSVCYGIIPGTTRAWYPSFFSPGCCAQICTRPHIGRVPKTLGLKRPRAGPSSPSAASQTVSAPFVWRLTHKVCSSTAQSKIGRTFSAPPLGRCLVKDVASETRALSLQSP